MGIERGSTAVPQTTPRTPQAPHSSQFRNVISTEAADSTIIRRAVERLLDVSSAPPAKNNKETASNVSSTLAAALFKQTPAGSVARGRRRNRHHDRIRRGDRRRNRRIGRV